MLENQEGSPRGVGGADLSPQWGAEAHFCNHTVNDAPAVNDEGEGGSFSAKTGAGAFISLTAGASLTVICSRFLTSPTAGERSAPPTPRGLPSSFSEHWDRSVYSTDTYLIRAFFFVCYSYRQGDTLFSPALLLDCEDNYRNQAAGGLGTYVSGVLLPVSDRANTGEGDATIFF